MNALWQPEKPRAALAKLLLQNGATCADEDPSTFSSLLTSAVRKSQLQMVSVVLGFGLDPNMREPGREGDLAIHVAARARNMSLVQVLVKHGASLDARGYDGETALHIATGLRYYAMMRFLVIAGADAAAKDANGEPAVGDTAMKAFRKRYPDVEFPL